MEPAKYTSRHLEIYISVMYEYPLKIRTLNVFCSFIFWGLLCKVGRKKCSKYSDAIFQTWLHDDLAFASPGYYEMATFTRDFS